MVRLWEYRGAAARVTLHLPDARAICSCGFDEQGVTQLVVSDTYTFDLPAFGIRTLMLRQGSAK